MSRGILDLDGFAFAYRAGGGGANGYRCPRGAIIHNTYIPYSYLTYGKGRCLFGLFIAIYVCYLAWYANCRDRGINVHQISF
jgi:hypothetical protein